MLNYNEDHITPEIFEKEDNFAILRYGTERELHDFHLRIPKLDTIVRIYLQKKNPGTPTDLLACKGMRQQVFTDLPSQLSEYRQFFEMKSGKTLSQGSLITNVEAKEVAELISNKSSNHTIILLTLSNCYNCITEVPFIKELALRFSTGNDTVIPKKKLARLDMALNDFPIGLPVVRRFPALLSWNTDSDRYDLVNGNNHSDWFQYFKLQIQPEYCKTLEALILEYEDVLLLIFGATMCLSQWTHPPSLMNSVTTELVSSSTSPNPFLLG